MKYEDDSITLEALEFVKKQTKISVEFKVMPMNETLMPQIIQGEEKAELEFATVEVPTSVLSFLCKAATLGAIAAKAAGIPDIPARTFDEDDNVEDQVTAEGLMGVLQDLWRSPHEASMELTMALLVSVILGQEGFKHESERVVKEFGDELDALPTFDPTSEQ